MKHKVTIVKEDNSNGGSYVAEINSVLKKLDTSGYQIVDIKPCNVCSTVIYRECMIIYKEN